MTTIKYYSAILCGMCYAILCAILCGMCCCLWGVCNRILVLGDRDGDMRCRISLRYW